MNFSRLNDATSGYYFRQNWYTTAIYNHLYIRAGGTAYRARIQGFIDETLPGVLTHAQLSQAKAEANALFETYFQGKPTSEYGTNLRGLQREQSFKATPPRGIVRQCPAIESPSYFRKLMVQSRWPAPSSTPAPGTKQ